MEKKWKMGKKTSSFSGERLILKKDIRQHALNTKQAYDIDTKSMRSKRQ
jgi:hypothetical protein